MREQTPTPYEFAKVMIRTMVIPFSLLFLIVTCSCTTEDNSPTILIGEYEIDEVIIEKPDETLVFDQDNEMIVFTATDMYFYYRNNDQWKENGSVRLTYKDDQLMKVGCRDVVSYDHTHITWTQDDWVITRRFKL